MFFSSPGCKGQDEVSLSLALFPFCDCSSLPGHIHFPLTTCPSQLRRRSHTRLFTTLIYMENISLRADWLPKKLTGAMENETLDL